MNFVRTRYLDTGSYFRPERRQSAHEGGKGVSLTHRPPLHPPSQGNIPGTHLCYQSQLVSLEFFIDIKSFRSHYGPGVDSASNRNEYQDYFLGVKAAGA